jgi:hypothetical protein
MKSIHLKIQIRNFLRRANSAANTGNTATTESM